MCKIVYWGLQIWRSGGRVRAPGPAPPPLDPLVKSGFQIEWPNVNESHILLCWKLLKSLAGNTWKLRKLQVKYMHTTNRKCKIILLHQRTLTQDLLRSSVQTIFNIPIVLPHLGMAVMLILYWWFWLNMCLCNKIHQHHSYHSKLKKQLEYNLDLLITIDHCTALFIKQVYWLFPEIWNSGFQNALEGNHCKGQDSTF